MGPVDNAHAASTELTLDLESSEKTAYVDRFRSDVEIPPSCSFMKAKESSP